MPEIIKKINNDPFTKPKIKPKNLFKNPLFIIFKSEKK